MSEKNKLAETLESAGPLVEAFVNFVQSGAIKNISMPNIPLRTGGGKVWWKNLAEKNGWKLQKNIIWGTCRILDPGNVRRAWGGEEAMMKALKEKA